MNIELRHLRAVVAVAEHRHFSEAARALHTSQPNLSRMIRHIETELDARLFDRHTRGVARRPSGATSSATPAACSTCMPAGWRS